MPRNRQGGGVANATGEGGRKAPEAFVRFLRHGLVVLVRAILGRQVGMEEVSVQEHVTAHVAVQTRCSWLAESSARDDPTVNCI